MTNIRRAAPIWRSRLGRGDLGILGAVDMGLGRPAITCGIFKVTTLRRRVELIRDDEAEPVGKRAAAQQVLSLIVDSNAEIEERVEARRVFMAVNDRLEGTPTASHRVIDASVPDVVQVAANLQAELVGAGRKQIEAPNKGDTGTSDGD